MAEEQTYTSTNIPPGGRKGQVLAKASDKAYHIKWASGGTGGDCGCESMSVVDIINILNKNNNKLEV